MCISALVGTEPSQIELKAKFHGGIFVKKKKGLSPLLFGEPNSLNFEVKILELLFIVSGFVTYSLNRV